jgi:mono/diheme cytochrome c family protein
MTRKQAPAIARAANASIKLVLGLVAAAGCERTPSIMPQTTLPATDLPCEVQTVMSARCWACHGETPTTPGIPSLTSVAAFIAASRTAPSQAIGAVGLARMQSTTSPMPPPPATAATVAEIEVISSWVASGYPAGSGCSPICTSGKTWREGNEGSPEMNPGMACIQCHAASDEGPRFSIAGTIYPTAHEPDLCDGAPPASGAQVIITGADGRTLTLAPNAAGNFYAETAVAAPYRARVVTAGGERAMTAAQTSGDCNTCHSIAGANGAPGRIMLP